MSDKQFALDRIYSAFQDVEFPGEHFLQGSYEGAEPYEEIAPFQEHKDWRTLDANFLDTHASSLSFFSEAGFRFFLPAYLIADLNDQLMTADPLFHLTHGFFDTTVNDSIRDRVFVLKSGKSVLLNPRRYGAMTFKDYARFRLSIFTREEAGAIISYLEFKRDQDADGIVQPSIDAALNSFWLERAQTAPTHEMLRRHLADEREYLAAIQSRMHGNQK